MRSLRDVVAVVLLLVATVLGAMWLPATWIQQNLVDREGFLAIAQPLGEDPAFREGLADDAVDALLDHDALPDFLVDRIDPIAREQATRFTETDLYSTLWDRTMIEVHESLFGTGSRDVVIDLAPAVGDIVTTIEETIPLVDLDAPESVPVTVATIPDLTILEKANLLDPWAARAGWIALACAVLALLLAGHRRAMVIVAGAAVMLAGSADWFLSRRIEQLIPDAADQADFIGPLFRAFEMRFAAEVGQQSLIMVGAGAAVIVVGAVILLVTSRPDTRGSWARGSRTSEDVWS